MPITITPYDDDPLCHGHIWEVTDVDALALQVARVAVGQSRHVKKILDGYTGTLPKPNIDTVANAAGMLTANSDTEAYHRDGWMFQVMSWLAACKAAPNGVIRVPHMIHAQKGFDGLQLEIDDRTKKVSAAIIFEDKATENPRDTIREEVWPDLRLLESGDRTNVLFTDVLTLLESVPGVDPDAAIENIIWNEARRYRVSITSTSIHRGKNGRKRLFKDYDDVAVGSTARRGGQVFEIPDLRNWMATLAARSIALLPTISA